MTINYAFSDNKSELKEYFKIRDQIYRSELQVDLDAISDEFYKKRSKYLIIKDSGKVIGGVRAVFSAHQPRDLPMEEEEGIDLQALFPDLHLDKIGYCEIGRICMLPEYRHPLFIKNAFAFLQANRGKNCHYIFGLAMLNHCRLYRRVTKSLGMTLDIRDDVFVDQSDKYPDLPDKLVLLSMKVEGKTAHEKK